MTQIFLFAAAALVLAFDITAAVGPSVIRKLRELKFGQKILEIGPKWHMKKGNVPTMGGVMFIFGAVVSALLLLLLVKPLTRGLVGGGKLWSGALSVLGLSLACGLIGFLDDWEKIKKKQNLGLTAWQKFLLQLAVAAVFILLLRRFGLVTPHLRVPFTSIVWTWPWGLYIPFMAFVIVGTVNAVNLTDGIDGLAGGVTMIVTLFFAVAALILCRHAYDAYANSLVGALAASGEGTERFWGSFVSLTGTAILSAALAGALGGFLLFNFNPARVFMGDTGALFLGAAVCGLAFAVDLPLILIPVGIIYIIETLSDILQIGYFKLTHGKRIFKMAPIHHHFELCGWSERKIDFVAYAITFVMCALSLWGVWRM